ncbi:MAG: hypothetical protein GX089_09345 [Fibrobacter sp.]|nr:hypothetical protein [Fibrobacter sp.]
MFRSILLLGIFGVFMAFAQDDDDVKADSIVYEKPTEWRVFSASGPVKAFTLQNNVLWFATQESVFSTSMKKAAEQKFPTLGKIAGSDVTCMVTDASGKVWIGGNNGVAVRSGNQFTNYTSENGLPSDAVSSMAASSDGKVWVGTDKGLVCFQGSSSKTYTTKDGLVSDKVQALMAGKKGDIWVGTNKGISVFDGAKWTLHDMKKGLSWNDVKALAQDSRKNVIWAAVGEKDVNCFENGKWNTYMEIQPGITSIMVDTQSRIWFGSETGLLKFNGDEWISDPKQLGIPAAQVFSLHRDNGGNLWFAMESGVVRLANPYPF